MSEPADTRAVEQLLELVRRFSGLDFPSGRRAGIERPIQSAMERLHVDSIGGLVRSLTEERHSNELERLVASMTIGETHFFRNHPQVDAIQTVILPDLISRHRRARRLRIWSAGCSSGEEAYSVAMAIDMLLPDRTGWTIEILGTDINQAAIDKARAGLYGEWSFRGVPHSLRARYFTPEGPRFRLNSAIREMVQFDYLNLVDDRYPSLESNTNDMDLILCRNVLIYFRPTTITDVVTRLEDALAPGGWLMAGHAESPMPIFRQIMDIHELPMAVLYRKRAQAARGGARPDERPSNASGASAASVDVAWPSVEPEPDVPLRELFILPEPVGAGDVAQPERVAVHDESVVARAQSMFSTGDRDGALALLQAAADATPDDGAALIAAARLLAGVVQYEAAEHVVRMAIDREPGAAGAHYVHALILQGLGRVDDALEALRRSSYLDPSSPLTAFSLASLFDTIGRSDRSRKALDRTVELLDALDDESIIDRHEGLTAGRLRKLTEIRRQLLHDEVEA